MLSEVLWELGKRKVLGSERRIHAWSVGCSAGEEAYSLVLAWEQALRSQFLPCSIALQCLGTDSSADAVAAAQAAEYSVHAVQVREHSGPCGPWACL